MNTAPDTEFIILENIYDSARQHNQLRQRDLAQIAGASLGMTNSILKRLAQKGWITAKKLNCRNIQYAVTIEGMNEIVHRSYRYFKRTIKNVVFYKEILEDLVSQARSKGIARVVLVGKSDLDFIVEHACRRYGLSFTKKTEHRASPETGDLLIFAESITEMHDDKSLPNENVFFLSALIIKRAAAIE